jgi:HlyD family secretion protein
VPGGAGGNPARLKAEIKIVETQAKDVAPGRRPRLTRATARLPATWCGWTRRQNGTVTVDVTLDEPLPRAPVPTCPSRVIELERLADVLFVGRPVQGQADSLVGLFRLSPGGQDAERVRVQLGRSSVNYIEVISGLDLGDTILLNDMSQFDAHDRVRVN